MKNMKHDTELCVVGGGMAGICAAVAAARKGIKVVLVHDRPVLGGNASSEIRMWICGAHGDENRERGIIEEILLDNLYYNTHQTYAMWDAVLYNKVSAEPNITLLLNASVMDAVMDGNKISSVEAWQGTTETFHIVTARLFADC
jgi:succinate dehydrogenase/fumarate reductase flavoprotein subunit